MKGGIKMAFDGFVSHSIKNELSELLTQGKIDKIYQPEKDELIISVRTHSGPRKLLISAASSNPRIHITSHSSENPITAPLFCMILRKHLTGGKIISVTQHGFDRVLKLDIECYTEMGDLTVKSLICEIMGKHSNIILINSDKKIIDSIKHIDFTVSAVRQILPGLIYELPPSQGKLNPLEITAETLCEKLRLTPDDLPLDKLLLSQIEGLSPLLSREIIYRFLKTPKAAVGDADPELFSEHVLKFIAETTANTGGFIVTDPTGGRPVAFSCTRLTQYEGSAAAKEYESISECTEQFFFSRDRQDRLSQKAAGTIKLINNNIDRCEKKIAIHKEILEKSKNRSKYKIYGDLLTANLYRIEPNTSEVTVSNFYSDPPSEITVSLSAELTPSQNAQRYYKLYNKAKAAENHSLEQLENAESELAYLETVLDAASRASSYNDISEIREELAGQGYITVSGGKKKKKQQKKSAPLEFVTSDGYTVLVGRNNKQNDELTVKMSYSTDIWLHTKAIPGSHTLIRTNQNPNVPASTILEAATIAAYYSKAQNSASVPVDYTEVKNVKKPNGSKPGFVIYETNNTVYVTPSRETVENLKRDK